MCGIVGIRRFDGQPVTEAALRSMSDQLIHRGPDDSGFVTRGTVGLGHRRLSIIDLERSVQPMSNPDRSLHVCFNGEILNYRELRAASPYPYQTDGDTEVLLSTFDKFGVASVSKLIGQFAYAIYSEHDDNLWLFRDRLGILPLYYYHDDVLFAFASEVKALLPVLPTPPTVDLASIDSYLARRTVSAPWTLFKNIRKLAPGSTMSVDADGAARGPESYWSVPSTQAVRSSHVVPQCRSELISAVERSLVSDVPVGAYLSGGLDSSLIVAVMRLLSPSGDLRSYTASFGEGSHNETAYARQMALLKDTIHREVAVSPKTFMDLWPLLTWHRDAPISEASDVAVYELARAAHADGLKVVLSGEGSDELFAGYPKHQFAALTRRIGCVPANWRARAGEMIQVRMGKRLTRPRTAVRALMEPDWSDRLEGWFSPFSTVERRQLLGDIAFHSRNANPELESDSLRGMLVYDVRGWLTDNLLERGDRMSMAASVELRPPFLDTAFADWAFQLPSQFKLHKRTSKWIIREAARGLVPDNIIDRPKIGFRVPLDDWFRGSMMDTAKRALLADDSFVANALNRPALGALVDRHLSGQANEGLRIWTLLSLEVWYRVFFGGDLTVLAEP
jgi:asparagine synthase (glutamine-hydrolysing)